MSTSTPPTTPGCMSFQPTSPFATSTCTSRTPSDPPSGWPTSSSRSATATTWPSSIARPASRWPARACSPQPTRSSCRPFPPRCRSAPSTNSPSSSPPSWERPAILPFASMVDRRKKLQRELVAKLAEETPNFLLHDHSECQCHRADGRGAGTCRRLRPDQPTGSAFRSAVSDIAAQPIRVAEWSGWLPALAPWRNGLFASAQAARSTSLLALIDGSRW